MRRFATIAVLGGALALTACGGPVQTNVGGPPAQPLQQPTSSTGSPATSSSAPEEPSGGGGGGTPKCTSADVKGEFAPPDSDHVRLEEIIATNTSGKTCTIYGYGGLAIFTGGDGADLHVKLTREPKPAPALVTLSPGAKAYKKVTWEFATDPTGATTGCKQGAGFAGVTLPDDTKTFEAHPQDGQNDLGDICSDIMGYAWTAHSTMGS